MSLVIKDILPSHETDQETFHGRINEVYRGLFWHEIFDNCNNLLNLFPTEKEQIDCIVNFINFIFKNCVSVPWKYHIYFYLFLKEKLHIKINSKIMEDILIGCSYRWLKHDSSINEGILIYNRDFNIGIFAKKTDSIITKKKIQLITLNEELNFSRKSSFYYCYFNNNIFEDSFKEVVIDEKF